MNNTCYVVWGRIHGSTVLVKLHAELSRKRAENWMLKNRAYYEDMRIYKGVGGASI